MKDIYEQIACIKRELIMRRRVYPRLLVAEKMTEATAEHEIECMRAVLKSLENIAAPPLIPEEPEK